MHDASQCEHADTAALEAYLSVGRLASTLFLIKDRLLKAGLKEIHMLRQCATDPDERPVLTGMVSVQVTSELELTWLVDLWYRDGQWRVEVSISLNDDPLEEYENVVTSFLEAHRELSNSLEWLVQHSDVSAILRDIGPGRDRLP